MGTGEGIDGNAAELGESVSDVVVLWRAHNDCVWLALVSGVDFLQEKSTVG